MLATTGLNGDHKIDPFLRNAVPFFAGKINIVWQTFGRPVFQISPISHFALQKNSSTVITKECIQLQSFIYLLFFIFQAVFNLLFNLQMVVQFSDNCVDCENVRGIKRKDMEHFVQRFSVLSKDEIAVEMMVTSQDILNMLAHMVPCVGCRRRLVFGFNSVYVGKSLIKV